MRSVKLPGTGNRVTPQLGFGCAFLLGKKLDRSKSRRLLDAAWDAGIRYFDVARAYGQGHTEGILGDFLRAHPESSVTTKYGLFPPSTARRIATGIQRRIPGLKMPIFDSVSRRCATWDGVEARVSLERSMRLLKRDFIDLFLLHEPDPRDLAHDDLLAALDRAKEEGKIGEYGIGGEYARIPDLISQRKNYCRVLQFEWSVLGPDLDLPGIYRVHYRVFAPAARRVIARFEKEPALMRRWSGVTGEDLKDTRVLSSLLLRAALDAWPDSLALFSTANEAHIRESVDAAANARLNAGAGRLAALLRESSL
jgi:aryl-alcohol dehydrogenase-like predicted oxidoreductase